MAESDEIIKLFLSTSFYRHIMMYLQVTTFGLAMLASIVVATESYQTYLVLLFGRV